MAVSSVAQSALRPLIENAGGASSSGSASSLFGDILKSAVENVNRTEYEANAEALKIATGETDDLHTLMINSEKAELALYALVQVRNKALEAYNEIMRISL